MLTEQRHPVTKNLRQTIKTSTADGLEQLFTVDRDISDTLTQIAKQSDLINAASHAIYEALENNKKIYIYGCGATGRLAKQVESGTWRPFCRFIKSQENIWAKLKDKVGDIENMVIGELTGGDRALVSSLEGFEDLQLIGELQLKQHNIQKGDIVFSVTEGGETSSVIGTILTAHRQYEQGNDEESRKRLFFIFNNPVEVLEPFHRSKSVFDNAGITKICLSTGHQALAGSTRMQATTIEQFFLSVLLEDALNQYLKKFLDRDELAQLGFDQDQSIQDRLLSFAKIQESIMKQTEKLAQFTDLESDTYKNKFYSTYLASLGLVTVFTDVTERSPTFSLFPLSTAAQIMREDRKSWTQILTPASTQGEAWINLLGRKFQGLGQEMYGHPFSTQIENQYLRDKALKSLLNAGDDQEQIYDFSYQDSKNEQIKPLQGDLGIITLFHSEINLLLHDSKVVSFMKLFNEGGAKLVILLLVPSVLEDDNEIIGKVREMGTNTQILQIPLDITYDPMQLRYQIAMKMILNAHSTALMTKLGLVVGNTMTSVRPGNLKLVGRATNLIKVHCDDVLSQKKISEIITEISYNDANTVLFDAIEYRNKQEKQQATSEVPMSIVKILESIKQNNNIEWEDAEKILEKMGLEEYLLSLQ